MDHDFFSSSLWFAFGCVCLLCIHRVVTRICGCGEVTSENAYKKYGVELEIEREKTKQSEITKQCHLIIKDREAEASNNKRNKGKA